MLIASCLALVFSLVKLADAMVAARDVAGASVGIGPFGVVAGSTLAVVGVALGLLSRRVVIRT